MFILSFNNGDNDSTRNSFEKNSKDVKIKYFNVLTGNKTFFDQPVKNKQEAYAKLVKMLINNSNITGNFLNYLYH